ncbi:hypothetical protein ACNPPY_26910 [Achromobacter sp. AGC78]
MNKIIIVGHPSTPLLDIEKLLRECGMAGALPSRKEGFTPAELGATLLKAHGVPSDALTLGPGTLNQLEPGPIWQSLVLDLMLGNIDQHFWGWSDSNAIHLLDYWKRLDPALKFVFIYSKPAAALTPAENDAHIGDPKVLDQRLRGWRAFNSEMLHFFNRNPERSVLVHVEEATSSVKTYLQHLRTRLDAPLAEPPAYLLENQASDFSRNVAHWDRSDSAIGGLARYGDLNHEQNPSESLTSKGALKHFLAEQLVAQFPEAGQLYEDLQSVATLPERRSEQTSLPILSAWLDFRSLEQSLADKEQALSEYMANTAAEKAASIQKLELLEDVNRGLNEQINSLSLVNAAIKDELHVAHGLAEAANRDALAERNELLSQLLTVQEDLERRSAAAATEKLASERINIQLVNAQVEAAANARAFDERLKAVDKDKAELRSEYEQLFAQLRIVHEELELLYRDNRELRKREILRNPPLYGAADRIKQQLTYRLGATILDSSKSLSGWVCMPAALIQTTRNFKRARRASANVKLPPISQYRDAQEAEKVKQHLSYRLGKALLQNIGSPIGWFRLPAAMRRSVREFEASRATKK